MERKAGFLIQLLRVYLEIHCYVVSTKHHILKCISAY